MSVFSGSYIVDVLLALLLIVYFIYWYLTKNSDYWDKRGVPTIKEGLFTSLIKKKPFTITALEWYEKYPDQRYVGGFMVNKPMILVRDTELIHKILVKDFIHFYNRGQPQLDHDPLSKNLFNLEGQLWRSLRYKLTPTFTSGKLKGMFEQISKCGDNMIKMVEEHVMRNNDIEAKTFLFEFMADVTASCTFGVQFEPNSKEFEMFKTAVDIVFKNSTSQLLNFAISMSSLKLAKLMNVTFVPKQSGDYFLNLTKATMKYRKDNNIIRNDYLQLLMTLKEQEDSGRDLGLSMSDATEDDTFVDQMKFTEQKHVSSLANFKFFTEETICANSLIFLVAGTESTSNTVSFALYELARHPHVQDLLHQEIDTTLASHKGIWSYQAIKDMTYLDEVIQEVQRLYPVATPLLLRECAESYQVPGSDLVLEKGVMVAISVVGLHRDPQHYPEPEEFRPERFRDNNFKPNSTFLPFGDGPRICIAMRFSVVVMKTCVARLMSQYRVKLSPQTKVPPEFDAQSFVMKLKGGVWVQFEKREAST